MQGASQVGPVHPHGNVTHQRRPMLRFFACEEDLSHELPDTVPDAIVSGAEPYWVVAVIACV